MTNNNETKNKDLSNNKKFNFSATTSKVMLIIGVLFIIIAGIVFGTTTWLKLNDFFKVIVLITVSIVFFALSNLLEKKLLLDKTGFAFYTLGCAFFPTAILSAGFFELFGIWFSLKGNGQSLLLALTSVTLCICSYFGVKKYSSKFFSYLFYSMITITYINFCAQFIENRDVLWLIISLYALIVSLLEEKVSKFKNILSKNFTHFIIANTLILALLSVIMTGNSIYSFISLTMFAVIFLKNLFNEDFIGIGVYAYSAFMVIACIKLLSPTTPNEILLTATASISAISVLNLSLNFDKYMLIALKITSIFASVTGLMLFGVAFLLFPSDWNYLNQLSLAIMVANVFLLAYKSKNKYAYMLFAFIVTMFNVCLVKLIGINDLNVVSLIKNYDNSLKASFLSVFMMISQLVYIKVKRLPLRSEFSDVLFTLTVILSLITCSLTEYGAIISTICIIVITLSVILNKNNENLYKLYSCFLPWTLIMILPYFHVTLPVTININLFFTLFITLMSLILIAINYKKIYVNEYLEQGFIILALTFAVFGMLANIYRTNFYAIAYLFIGLAKMVVNFKEDKPKDWMYISYFSGMFLIANIFFYVFENLGIYSKDYLLIVCSLIFILGVILRLIADKKFNYYKKDLILATNIHLILTSIFVSIYPLLLNHYDNVVYFYIAISICVLSIIIQNNDKLASFVSGISLIVVLSKFMIIIELKELLVLYSLLALTGTLLYHKKLNLSKCNPLIDWITFACFVPTLRITVEFLLIDQSKESLSWIAIGIYILLWAGRLKDKNLNKILLTLGVFLINLGISTQSLIQIPEILKLELRLLPLALLCVEIKLFWKEYDNDWFIFGIAGFIILVLGIDALRTGNVFDTLFISISNLLILFLAHYFKRIKWFALSSSVLVFLGIYMTKSFWQSGAWWLYLMLVGFILIAIAAINEYNRKHTEKIKLKVKSLLKDWKW